MNMMESMLNAYKIIIACMYVQYALKGDHHNAKLREPYSHVHDE